MDMVTQAMKDATSEGGRYYNMMQKMSKTAGGQLSTLQDNWNMTLASFGKEILPIAIKGMSALSNLLAKINAMTPAQKKTMLVIAGIVALIGPLVAGIGTVISVITSLSVVAGTLGVTMGAALGIVAGIPLAIGAVVAALVLLWKNWDKIWNGIKNITANIINGIVSFINKLLDRFGWLRALAESLSKTKFVQNLAGAMGGAINNNSVRQTQNNTTNNSSVVNNYNYGSQQKNTISGIIKPAYVAPAIP